MVTVDTRNVYIETTDLQTLAGRINYNLNKSVATIDSSGKVVVPHTRQLTKLLRKEGYDVPAPILTQYHFPVSDPTKPAFLVQKITCAMLSIDPRAYVLNELGTGKTRCILWSYDYLRKVKLAKKLLVICPISALERTWGNEIMNEFPHLTYQVLYGTKLRRLRRLSFLADIYLINHDGLEIIKDELIARQDINVVCVDECASYRNGRTNRTIALREFTQHKTWVWGMTGSPMPRAVTDVWGPCSAITPNTIPQFFTAFRAMLMLKKGPFKWVPKVGAEERAVSCMQPSVRFKLADVTELPERVLQYYEAPMTSMQELAYNEMRKTAITLIGGEKIDALNAGAVLSKLLQVACGFVYTREGKVVDLKNVERLQLVVDLIDSSLHKVILFANFKSAVNNLSNMLTLNKIEHAIVTGDVSLKQRTAIFTAFEDTNKFKVLLAHPQCMSHALTLNAATTTIWFGPVTSLEIFQQANARNYRVGQNNKTLVAMIGGSEMEKRIYNLLGRNERVQDHFLELLEAQSAKLLQAAE